MTTQQSQATVTKARAALTAAEKRQAEAVQVAADAERAAAELRQRNAAGDSTVSGLDLLTADADIEAANGLAVAAARGVDQTRQHLGELIADKVAAEVAARYAPSRVDGETQRIRKAITDALGSLAALIRERDSVSDEAGRTLAAAGVPMYQQIGRISYSPVTNGISSKPIAGSYNVTIDGNAISSRNGHRATVREIERRGNELLAAALRANGMHLTDDHIRLR